MPDLPEDPLWQREPIAVTASFAPLNIAVQVEATHSALATWAAEVLGPQASASAQRPALRFILVGDSHASGARASPIPREDLPQAEQPALHRERGGLFVASVPLCGLVTADLDNGRAAAFVERRALISDARRLLAAEALVGAPVWRFAASRGLVALHGAAVVTGEGPVVIRGPSGSGKTTAACALGLAGCPVLADEVVWLDFLGEQPVLRGAYPFVRPEPASYRLLPALTELTPRVGTVALGSGGLPRAASAPIGPVAFLGPRDASGAGSFRRLDYPAALARFDDATIPGELTQAPDALRRAREALIQAGAFDVTVGNLSALPDLMAAIAAAATR